ncbi:MAG: hypothetical protein L0191_10475 [Acidobacteria bacterium]|nr:hypothetical protein [Acidobacteriota bacterium]
MKELVTPQLLETVPDGGAAMVPGMEEQKGSPALRCPTCGRMFDLRCGDCGCPVSCHDFVYPKDDERVPYCVWDFGPCPKERRPVFFAAIEAWLRDVKPPLPKHGQPNSQGDGSVKRQ